MSDDGSIVSEIAKFFDLDLEWIEHLISKSFTCGCTSDYEGDPEYCELYELEREVSVKRLQLNKAIEALETFRARKK